MKRIFEFLEIIGILFCILAAVSLAELAYGGTLDDVLNYQYEYSMQKDDKSYDCVVDFANTLEAVGYYGKRYLSITCTEKAEGVSYNSFGGLYFWDFKSGVIKIGENKFAVISADDTSVIYPICGEPIKRKD